MKYTASELMSFGVPAAVARSVATKAIVPLDTTNPWVQTSSGTGSASIDAANKRAVLTIQNTGIGECANQILISSLERNITDSSRIEIVSRFKIENGNVNSRASISFVSSTTPDSFVVMSWGDGTVERGASISGSWFSAGFSPPSTVPTDGTGWLRMRVDGTTLEFSYGVGSETDEPTRWRVVNNSNFSFPSDGYHQFNRIDLFAGQYVSPTSSELRVYFSNIYVRQL